MSHRLLLLAAFAALLCSGPAGAQASSENEAEGAAIGDTDLPPDAPGAAPPEKHDADAKAGAAGDDDADDDDDASGDVNDDDDASGDVNDNDDEAEEGVDPTVGDWGIGLVPKLTINGDDGIGFGVRGTWFWYKWNQRPYKTAVSFQAWVTTKLVQHHYLRVDAIDAFNLPVRILAEVGYFQTLAYNFCGFGAATTCDPAVADADISQLGLHPGIAAQRKNNYYRVRFMRPYAMTNVAWRLMQMGTAKVSLFGGWRGFYYLPGTIFDGDQSGWPDLHPYPNSLFAQAFPDGQRGLASVLQVGAQIDARDNEPAPRRGYLIEGSARVSHPWILSRWSYSGFNLTARTYVPLTRSKNIVWATRAVGDLMFGDPPLQEMIRVGGSQDYTAFGGSEMGRGIRIQRYPGRVKLMLQNEIRYEFPSFHFLTQDIRFGFAGFLDAGSIGVGLNDWGSNPFLARLSFGISGRVAFNDNFVMRLDIGVSQDEGYLPVVYSGPNHPF